MDARDSTNGSELLKVFISHAHQDAALAARVAQALQGSGLEAWDADTNLLPGDNWAAEVARALEESQAMVVLLTPDAIDSVWVLREIEYALGAKITATASFRLSSATVSAFPIRASRGSFGKCLGSSCAKARAGCRRSSRLRTQS